jgi:N-methylhydantoinase A
MRYRIGVDVGGTFTDFLLCHDSGVLRQTKVPSTPDDLSEGFVAGLALLARAEALDLGAFLARVGLIVHGTTVTTNAILTGNVARAGLLTTRGFRDALAMRRGIRESQYDNRYTAPPPLVPRWLRLPVAERVDVEGRVVEPLDRAGLARALQALAQAGVEAVAICFLHAWANPAHETEAERAATESLPGAYVTRSSALLPQIRFTERVSTTVLNAAVGPILARYLDTLTARLAREGFRGTLLIMQSSGGVTSPAGARSAAAGTLLSGPAAAPTAGLAWSAPHRGRDLVTVDMGGTSFDVCLVKDGSPAMTAEGRIARYPFGLPSLAIHTIGAGGGSIGWIDAGGLLRMGPTSAGARPGPACYGLGGTSPTCTDADLLLGYVAPDRFLGGRLRLDAGAAREAVGTLARALARSVEKTAAGMVEVIDANMAAGIRHVTVERGHDPRDFLLVVGGGAGPVHASGIARELDLARVLVPRGSSIFCAAGLVLADLRRDVVRTHVSPFDQADRGQLRILAGTLTDEGQGALRAAGVSPDRVGVSLACDVRYVGQYHEITVPWLSEEALTGDLGGVAKRFHEAHDRLYGYALPDAPLELVNVRATAVGRAERVPLPEVPRGDAAGARKGLRRMWVAEDGVFADVPVYDGETLGAGARMDGPAAVEYEATTAVLGAGWRAETDRHGSLLMERR